jgi:hypothetical protein
MKSVPPRERGFAVDFLPRTTRPMSWPAAKVDA